MKLIFKNHVQDGFIAMWHSPTEEVTFDCGRAFSQAISPEHVLTSLVYTSLEGDSGVGKTQFCFGLMTELFAVHAPHRNQPKISMENLNRAPMTICSDEISVHHYDAQDDPDFVPNTDNDEHMHLILGEHIPEDEHDLMNFRLKFKTQADGSRLITLKCSSDQAEQPGVQAFLNLFEPHARVA